MSKVEEKKSSSPENRSMTEEPSVKQTLITNHDQRRADTLNITNLSSFATKFNIENLFKSYEVIEIQMQVSKNSCLVQFSSSDMALKAKRECMYASIHDIPVLITDYNEHLEYEAGAKLEIQNLPKLVELKKLHAYFESIKAQVAFVWIEENKGYVQYFKEEDARLAIQKLDGKLYQDKNLKLVPASQTLTSDRNLYIQNLPKGSNPKDIENTVRSEFAKFGKITSIKIVNDYGFVCFENNTEAKNALDTLTSNPIKLKGANSNLIVRFYQKNGPQSKSTSKNNGLFIRDLKPVTNEQDLKKELEAFAQVQKIELSDYKVNSEVKWKFAKVYLEKADEIKSVLDNCSKSVKLSEFFIHGVPDIALLGQSTNFYEKISLAKHNSNEDYVPKKEKIQENEDEQLLKEIEQLEIQARISEGSSPLNIGKIRSLISRMDQRLESLINDEKLISKLKNIIDKQDPKKLVELVEIPNEDLIFEIFKLDSK